MRAFVCPGILTGLDYSPGAFGHVELNDNSGFCRGRLQSRSMLCEGRQRLATGKQTVVKDVYMAT